LKNLTEKLNPNSNKSALTIQHFFFLFHIKRDTQNIDVNDLESYLSQFINHFLSCLIVHYKHLFFPSIFFIPYFLILVLKIIFFVSFYEYFFYLVLHIFFF